MLKREYEFLPKIGVPNVTCLVPEEWLALDLPAMGGAVDYQSRSGAERGEYVFEVALPEVGSDSTCLCVLRIIKIPDQQLMSAFSGREIAINCQNPRHNNQASAEVALLHHLFCLFAGSALTGVSWVDIADLVEWLSDQSELSFSYSVARRPMQFRRRLVRIGRGAGEGGYAVLTGRFGYAKMARIRELGRMLRTTMIYAPAVTDGVGVVSALTP